MLSKNIHIEQLMLLNSLAEANYDSSVAAMKGLIENTGLTTLSYHQITTPLTGIQCRFIADLIAQSTKLQGFSLSQCSIPAMAFPVILQAITAHSCITDLTFEDITLINFHLEDPVVDADVGYTKIADEQAILIAAMLTQNTRIRRLNLDDNEIEDQGGQALVDTLEKHPNLWEMKLSGSQFSSEIKRKIKELTGRNKALITSSPTYQAQASFWKARSADQTAMPEVPSLKSLCADAIKVLMTVKDEHATEAKIAILPAEIRPNI